jgi:calcineurin-like phosphoesterase
VLTLGNHVWRRADIADYLSGSERVIRPANLSSHAPGRGLAVGTALDGTSVAVLNLLGSLFIGPPVGPFEVVDALVEEARARTTGPLCEITMPGMRQVNLLDLLRLMDRRHIQEKR